MIYWSTLWLPLACEQYHHLGMISKDYSSTLQSREHEVAASLAFNINCLQVFLVCVQDHGASSLNVPAECVCFAACCGSAWTSTTCQWRHSMDISTLVMGPRIWTFPSCYKGTSFWQQSSHISLLFILIFKIKMYSIQDTAGLSVCLILEQIKGFSHAVCVYKLFVPFSSDA